MQFFRNLTAVTLAAGSLALMGGAANAQTALNPSSSVSPVPVVNAAPFGGTFVQTNSSTYDNTNAGVRITGTLLSSVYQVTSGPFGTVATPTYDFYYQLFVDAASSVGADSMSLSNFAPGGIPASLQVGQDTDGGVTGETAQVASIGGSNRNGSGGGVTVQFSGVNGLTPGSTSSIFVVRTNAINFSTTGGAAVLGTQGVSANTTANVLAPGSISTAPEPGSIALLGVGFAGMMGMIARRKKSA